MIGYAFCGSYCTHAASLLQLERLIGEGYEIQPIVSENVFSTDTRFGKAEALAARLEALTGREVIHSIVDAEPLGPKIALDALIIAPCTGNTLAKLADGITDTAVCMAAKAHLRCDGPMLVALCSNDAMSQNLSNISTLLQRKSVYFLPMRQDNPIGKPHSLVADMTKLCDAFLAMKNGEQIRPIFI